MTPKTPSKPQTGPLSPQQIGLFSFRDGVWYVQPKAPKSTKS
jgi:hypothetical protein